MIQILEKEIGLEYEILFSIMNNFYEGIYFIDRERKIRYWNKGAENITGYSMSEALGTCCFQGLLAHIDEEGNGLCDDDCPVIEAMEKGNYIDRRLYLKHKDGNRVPVWTRVIPIKNNMDTVTGAVQLFVDDSDYDHLKEAYNTIEHLNRELGNLANIDDLTSLKNRRAFFELARKEFNRSMRYQNTLALLMIDIDDFKIINDTFNHQTGDLVLIEIANAIKSSTRDSDIIGRYGGEEFIVLLSVVDNNNVMFVAEKIRKRIEEMDFYHLKTKIKLSVSIGVAIKNPGDYISLEKLIEQADIAMNRAKKRGKNKSKIFKD